MKFFLFLFFTISLLFSKNYKGEVYFYDLQDKQIFAVIYKDPPFISVFDKDINQTSPSFIVLSDHNKIKEISIFKNSKIWKDHNDIYTINNSKELMLGKKKFKAQVLGSATLCLIENQNNIKIKSSLDFLNNNQFKSFHNLSQHYFDFEQIFQKPVFYKDGKLSIQEQYYFYEDEMERPILELNNFVYDTKRDIFVNLDDLYDVKNRKFLDLLHQKLKNFCNECFEDVEQIGFNNNFLLTPYGFKICYLPFENHFLDENICIDFFKNEIGEFKK
ncbi:hypothetical protein [Campylobacter estrildidarum]|uniref:Uncharacterized protein n=1 Tax=Campylobacter estrildidarum TaxID=2510189 RepID=A0A4U7BMB8_9BACT|nr:hypothetical protein [Campylobacter estrildidarum]TKX31310.1 hypothetical protein CQA69_03445 [Campylobacter estrildidarum]